MGVGGGSAFHGLRLSDQERDGDSRQPRDAPPGISSFARLDAVLLVSSQNPFMLHEAWAQEVRLCALSVWLKLF